MKKFAILLFLLIFALTGSGQTPKSNPKRIPKPVKTVPVVLADESEELEKALAVKDAAQRIAALENFVRNFPESAERARVQGQIVTARAELGVLKLQANDLAAGVELYKTAVEEAPVPVTDEIFAKVLLGFPVSLYTLNERAAAFDIAKLIEEKIGANGAQVLELSRFYLNVEYGTEAIRLAQKAVEFAPESAAAHQVLAAAYRLNFRLEDAARAYARAVELDDASTANRLSLAEMKRALGKADEAAAIYREVLSKEPENKPAQAGLALALLDSGKRADAETELKKALDADPENARLLTGAAYWYAARGFHDEAIEYSKKAIAIEPRNVWSYIAQARALTAQNKPLEAEKILLLARQHSDFPTLDYELASVRLAAGLYREAAETLKRSFTVNTDGAVETYLGNRILADAGSFAELLSLERRVALFETKSADTEENTARLKALLEFSQKLEAKEANEEELAAAAEKFAAGTDNMRLHRQLFAANRLLQKKTALPKVLELTQAAIGGVDSALNVASPSASVLADEIYDSRQYAISQNLIIVVPDIPRQTLSAILRGQIETIAGRALLEQNNTAQSVVRLKRAMSVLPDKSAWQRASAWHLGEALQADGQEKEALEAFIKGYHQEFPDPQKRAFIEDLYVKVTGSADGLDDRLGAKPETTVASTENRQTPANTDNVRTPSTMTPAPLFQRDPARIPRADATPEPSVTRAEPAPSPQNEETTEIKTEAKPETVTALPENVPPAPDEETDEKPAVPTPVTEVDEKPPVREEPAPVTEDDEQTEETDAAETSPEETTPEPSPSPAETTAEQPTTETKPEEAVSEDKKAAEAESAETPSEPVSSEEEARPEDKKPAEIKPEQTPATEEKPAATKTEALPRPQNVSVIVTDNLERNPPSKKAATERTEAQKTAPKPAVGGEKSLFEPVIISVGKSENPAPVKPAVKTTEEKLTAEKPAENSTEKAAVEDRPAEERPTEEKPSENPAGVKLTSSRQEKEKAVVRPKNPAVIITDNLSPENKSTEKPAAVAPSEKPADEKLLSGELRPRIIITENTGARTVTEEIATCKLVVAPDSISLLNGGGSLGVSVAFDSEGDFRRIRAVSSSAADVEVRADAEIGASQSRAFFIIKSVSTKTGVFTVTFEAPCGRKEILVRVR